MDSETDMVRQIRALDSDMQTLVYENYNKFISATGDPHWDTFLTLLHASFFPHCVGKSSRNSERGDLDARPP
jgi:hypothetical protein